MSKKTYFHYLCHKLKHSWNKNRQDVYVNAWLIISFGLIFSSIPISFFIPEIIAIGILLSGALLLIIPLPLIWVIQKIQDEISNFKHWKKED